MITINIILYFIFSGIVIKDITAKSSINDTIHPKRSIRALQLFPKKHRRITSPLINLIFTYNQGEDHISNKWNNHPYSGKHSFSSPFENVDLMPSESRNEYTAIENPYKKFAIRTPSPIFDGNIGAITYFTAFYSRIAMTTERPFIIYSTKQNGYKMNMNNNNHNNNNYRATRTTRKLYTEYGSYRTNKHDNNYKTTPRFHVTTARHNIRKVLNENEDSNKCGKSLTGFTQSRIIGGRDVAKNEFPWIVALYEDDEGFFCGGAILNSRWIITAAHCVTKIQPNLLEGIVGANDLREKSRISLKFNRIVSHRQFRSDTYENDIALLHTTTNIPLPPKTKETNTICLPDSGKTFKGNAIAAGWGRTTEGGKESNTLMAVDINLYADDQCKKYYKSAFFVGKQICAGNDSGKKDTCQGDSGGPLAKINGDQAYLIGIVSFGRGCGRKGSPGVYTKVSNYIDWINDNMKN